MRLRVRVAMAILSTIVLASMMSGGPAAAPRPAVIPAGPGWVGVSDRYAVNYAASVAGAGDVNGDGFADILVGSYNFGVISGGEGRVQLHLGSGAGPIDVPSWTANGSEAGAWFGYAVASAGDVNGDGFADVLVGAPLQNAGGTDAGMAFLYYGSAAGLATDPAWRVPGALPRARFGHSVASAGDVNADGYADVIIGAPLQDGFVSAEEGRVYLYLGSAEGLSTTPVWIGAPNLYGAAYGYSVASAGDVNGDGHADVVVGAPLYDAAGFYDQGRVYVYAGGPGGLSADPIWNADSLVTLARFGHSVAGAGDTNGDGFADIVIGSPDDGSGRAHVYVGSATGLQIDSDWIGRSRRQTADYGAAVAPVGDFDLDGYADVVIGAPTASDRDQPNEGYVYIYSGGGRGLPRQTIATLQGDSPNANFGAAVAGAGDVNGDGVTDLIVGAPGFDNGISQGRVYVYYGGVTRN